MTAIQETDNVVQEYVVHFYVDDCAPDAPSPYYRHTVRHFKESLVQVKIWTEQIIDNRGFFFAEIYIRSGTEEKLITRIELF